MEEQGFYVHSNAFGYNGNVSVSFPSNKVDELAPSLYGSKVLYSNIKEDLSLPKELNHLKSKGVMIRQASKIFDHTIPVSLNPSSTLESLIRNETISRYEVNNLRDNLRKTGINDETAIENLIFDYFHFPKNIREDMFNANVKTFQSQKEYSSMIKSIEVGFNTLETFKL